jgi:hypothetical protein
VVTGGVIFKVAPVASGLLQEEDVPQLPLYHFHTPPVPVLPLTLRVTELPLQIELPITLLLMAVGPQA